MAHACAAIMAREEEPLMPKTVHYLEHVLGQCRRAVVDVIGTGVGQRTVTVTAQIGENYVIAFGQPRGYTKPRRVVLRIAVEEQQRRARTAMAQANVG